MLIGSDWAKKNYMTTNQINQLKMLQKMHPSLFEKFGNQMRLNQKFHPKMTGKILNDLTSFSKTPNMSTNKEIILLQTPVQPKPPSFFEQAYLGKEDPRKRATLSQTRPFSAHKQDDMHTYMSHHKLKQQMEKQQKTLDPYQLSRTKKAKKKVKNEEEEEWERFNEQVSYKSGVSRRSSKSHNSRVANRIKSAARHRHQLPQERLGTANGSRVGELTQQNLKDFEERVSTAAASKRREKIVFSDKPQEPKHAEEKQPDDELNRDENLENEGEGEAEVENPNEPELENGLKNDHPDHVSILSRSEVQSLSKASRKSYVESLRNELMREREKRRELEMKVKELTDSRK